MNSFSYYHDIVLETLQKYCHEYVMYIIFYTIYLPISYVYFISKFSYEKYIEKYVNKLYQIWSYLDWKRKNTQWTPVQKLDSNELVVEIWEMYVYEGLMDAIHGGGSTIKEFYFPELDFAFNLHNGTNLIDDASKRYRYEFNKLIKNSAQPKLLKSITIDGTSIRKLQIHHKYLKKAEEGLEQIMEEMLEYL